jgi:hypothetical protein
MIVVFIDYTGKGDYHQERAAGRPLFLRGALRGEMP